MSDDWVELRTQSLPNLYPIRKNKRSGGIDRGLGSPLRLAPATRVGGKLPNRPLSPPPALTAYSIKIMPAHSLRSDEVERRVLQAISQGTPLAVVCREEGMPTDQTWRTWCAEDQALAIAYARAREDGFDRIAADCLKIGDEVEPDSAEVSKAKLRVETRLKLLAKWDPKRYGDKLETTLQGPNGGPVQTNTVLGLDPSQFSEGFLRELAEKKVDGS